MRQELRFHQAEQRCFRVYSDYLHFLEDWKVMYAPKPEDEVWHPLFSEALEKQTYVEYLLDMLLSGTMEDRVALVTAKGKEVMQLERRLSEAAACSAGRTVPDSAWQKITDEEAGQMGLPF
ncbi:MAG: hypothetical protein LUC83_07995 [Clostridiales bacterium]|nr:hypothetical protein [Clostridiales bacterium]